MGPPPASLDDTPEDPTATAVEDDETPRRRRPWKLMLASAALLLIGVLAGGLVLGYRYAADRKVDPTTGASVKVSGEAKANPTDEAVETVMIDVIGLTRDQAIEALTDTGIASDAITFEEIPWVGAPGQIAQQSPPRGTADPAKITLKVSKAATVPDLVGKTDAEAAKALEAMGAVLDRETAYDPAQPKADVVLSTTPAKGAALTAVVKGVISAEPSSLYLAEVDADTSNCSEGGETATGASEKSLTCTTRYQSSSGEPTPTAVYLLAQKVTALEAKLSVSTAETTGTSGRLRIVADGASVFDEMVTWGETKDLRVDLRGVARLEFFFTPKDPENRDDSGIDLVLVEPTLKGAPDAMAELEQP